MVHLLYPFSMISWSFVSATSPVLMATNPRQPVPFAHDSSTILKPILDQLVLHSSLLVFTYFYKHFVGTHLGLTEHTHTQTPNSNRFYHHNVRLKWIETSGIKQPKCINMRHKLRAFHLWCLVAKKIQKVPFLFQTVSSGPELHQGTQSPPRQLRSSPLLCQPPESQVETSGWSRMIWAKMKMDEVYKLGNKWFYKAYPLVMSK